MTAELIHSVREDGTELVLVRYQKGLWAFCFHEDPGFDYAIDPTGYQCCDIWDIYGYSHYRVPAELFEQVEELLTASI